MFGMNIQNHVPSTDASLLAQQGYNQLAGYSMNNQSGLMDAAIAAQQYNTLLANASHQNIITKPKLWVFNGKECTVRQMADEIWHTDCPEKTHFLLKYE